MGCTLPIPYLTLLSYSAFNTLLGPSSPLNTSAASCLLCFGLLMHQLYLSCCISITNHIDCTVPVLFLPLNTSLIPYLLCFCIFIHQLYLACCILTSKHFNETFFAAFELLNISAMTCLIHFRL